MHVRACARVCLSVCARACVGLYKCLHMYMWGPEAFYHFRLYSFEAGCIPEPGVCLFWALLEASKFHPVLFSLPHMELRLLVCVECCACNMSAGIQTQALTIVQQGVFTIEPSIQPLSSRILSEGRPG